MSIIRVGKILLKIVSMRKNKVLYQNWLNYSILLFDSSPRPWAAYVFEKKPAKTRHGIVFLADDFICTHLYLKNGNEYNSKIAKLINNVTEMGLVLPNP